MADLDRVIRPQDVPAVLLNLALLNCGADDADLRAAAYSLLVVLCHVFKFDTTSQELVRTDGLSIPRNTIKFVVSVSASIARSVPKLTVEFLQDCLTAMSKSSMEQKHLCLEYMIPWLSNLLSSEANSLTTETELAKIIQQLLDLTVQEKEVRSMAILLHSCSDRCIRPSNRVFGTVSVRMRSLPNSF